MAGNSSGLIHPPGFYIIGFEKIPFINLYFIFLAFVYVVTVLFNGLVIYIITFNHCLHTPKFLAVVNLAAIDLILNTCTIPSMLKIFLIKDNFMSFNLCLVQMFFYYAFLPLESSALAILAYDRLVAICFPLRQTSINTLRNMSCIIGLTWFAALGLSVFCTAIITRLSFCKSVQVFSYFCDYAPVFRLACNDYTLHWSVASICSMLLLLGPFTFIVLSYIPPCINPIVYSLKTKEIKVRGMALVRKFKIGTT
ncbi:hypothetical protein LDENG_00220750 [Lucifuga dentata]|nr:hypothetical protein LDENG_00220750 [Lucifuga dentata]